MKEKKSFQKVSFRFSEPDIWLRVTLFLTGAARGLKVSPAFRGEGQTLAV